MERPTPTPRAGIPFGRAALLGTFAAGLGGIAVAPAVSRFALERRAARPAGSARCCRASAAAGASTACSRRSPRFDPADVRAQHHRPRREAAALRWSEVAALPGEHQTSDFHCVTGWSVDNVHWEGIRPQTIIDLVRPKAAAKFVTLQSLETPYVDQVSLDQFREPDVMLARAQDGKPLTRSHGAPLRLVLPSMYGYKNVKWVRELRFDATPAPGYWEQRGYDVDAWVGKSNGYGA